MGAGRNHRLKTFNTRAIAFVNNVSNPKIRVKDRREETRDNRRVLVGVGSNKRLVLKRDADHYGDLDEHCSRLSDCLREKKIVPENYVLVIPKIHFAPGGVKEW